jgi:hypothetical protein
VLKYDSEPISDPQRLSQIISYIRGIIARDPFVAELLYGKAMALKVAIDSIDGFIQACTAEVCPHCSNVCCINRHGYYDDEDLIYIISLGETLPYYKTGLSETDSCQFLRPTGCSVPRYLRPFRCNWYFCIPLIGFMRQRRGAEYRLFTSGMQEAIDLRAELIEIFKAIEVKHPEGPMW